MKTISPRDSSLLALLAEKPKSNSKMRRKVLDKLNDEALNIALEMGKSGLLPSITSDVRVKAASAARGLERWATSNKRSSRMRRKAK